MIISTISSAVRGVRVAGLQCRHEPPVVLGSIGQVIRRRLGLKAKILATSVSNCWFARVTFFAFLESAHSAPFGKRAAFCHIKLTVPQPTSLYPVGPLRGFPGCSVF